MSVKKSKSGEVKTEAAPTAEPKFHVDLGTGFLYPVKKIEISMVDSATGKPTEALHLFKPYAHANGEKAEGAAGGFEMSSDDMVIRIKGGVSINVVLQAGPPQCGNPPLPPCNEVPTVIVGDVKVHFNVKVEK